MLALFAAFLIYITTRGELGKYIAVFVPNGAQPLSNSLNLSSLTPWLKSFGASSSLPASAD